MNFDYYYGDESNQFAFYRIPRQLITGEAFKKLSTDAKLLYGLLLDRMGLSAKNGWYDDMGRVFIYYTLDEIQEDLNCGHEKAVRLLAELDTGKKGFGLIERVKQGQGRPTKIYAKKNVLFSVIKDTRSTSGIVDLVTNVDYVPLVNHYLEQRGYPAPAQEQGEEAPKKAAPRARPEHSSPQRGSGSTARQTRSTDTGTTETTEKPSVKSRLEALRAASEGMREPGRAPQAKGKTIPKSR